MPKQHFFKHPVRSLNSLYKLCSFKLRRNAFVVEVHCQNQSCCKSGALNFNGCVKAAKEHEKKEPIYLDVL